MAQRVSAQQARARFAELTDRVCYTGEPVIVEKKGKPFVAVVTVDDLNLLEQARAERRQAEFSARAARAAKSTSSPPSEKEIVEAVKRTREAIFRERYGAA